ncbi:sensor domain-containing diguanylate cyclase [Pseudomonas fontis]|uniref:diguanylate cyclase n=1 Tax=Pseudomonas fontis TaxID=2942633 RepID=A0ABT5NPC4_9PSED|nr:GGDEF domain-containing protein [Pseudomonas fontis]MDD0974471.1 GGDEF domain-containing protein [Pseudomonas fontis]MDD0990013.1 GGDEF domain-containing protein [Pseudomonas fontis]
MTESALQKLLLKRFLLAACTYGLVLLLVWTAIMGGHVLAPVGDMATGTGMLVFSQLVMGWVFLTGRNLRCRDPSLTECQVLLALTWQTWLLANLNQARGTFLVIYPLILMFGLFHLSGRAFVRCALLVFFSFTTLNLLEAHGGKLYDPPLAVLQVCTLFVVLAWLCLYARYVQASRLRMRQRRFALQAHQDTLRGMMGQLEELVATDELTGLFNRRHFLRLAGRELETMHMGVRHGLALIDLDHFKRINDVYGHAAGDQVLQAFAQVAQGCLDENAVLARYGGEEFVLLMPDCSADALVECCERIRLAFAGTQPSAVGLRVSALSLSAGMTLLTEGDDLDAALHRADEALYRAKRSGRDRCVAAWEVVDA